MSPAGFLCICDRLSCSDSFGMCFEQTVMCTSDLCSQLAASFQVLPPPTTTMMWAGNCVTAYMFTSCQGCNPLAWFVVGHVPLKTENVFVCSRHQRLVTVVFRCCVQINLLTYKIWSTICFEFSGQEQNNTQELSSSWDGQPFSHNKHRPNIAGAAVPVIGKLGPHLTQCRLGRGLPLYRVILIHPAIWPQQTWAENWGLCPFGGSLVPI